MPKHTIKELDAGQLELMWSFLKLKKECTCTKDTVRAFKETLDRIRTAMIQKTAGQRKDDGKDSVQFEDLGTYINIAICQALELYIYGGLDILENNLPEEVEAPSKERDNRGK